MNNPSKRIRENFGRYFDDFEIGYTYEHRPGRTISETDNTWFTLLTMNTHPLHFDKEYAKKSEFGKILVNSTLTLSVVVGMSVSDMSQKAIANLGWREIKLPNPVFVEDTLYSESTVISKRTSKSRKHQGIVTIETSGINQKGKTICTFERTMLIPFKGFGVDDEQP